MKFSSFIVEMDNMPPSEPQEVDKPVSDDKPKIITPNKKLILPAQPKREKPQGFTPEKTAPLKVDSFPNKPKMPGTYDVVDTENLREHIRGIHQDVREYYIQMGGDKGELYQQYQKDPDNEYDFDYEQSMKDLKKDTDGMSAYELLGHDNMAMKRYVMGSYELGDYLRSGMPPRGKGWQPKSKRFGREDNLTDEEYEYLMREMHSHLYNNAEHYTYHDTVYRGLNNNPFENLQSGQIIGDPAFMSTATDDKGTASDFSMGGVMMKINKAGNRASVDMDYWGDNDQDELAFIPNTALQFTHIGEDDGYYNFNMLEPSFGEINKYGRVDPNSEAAENYDGYDYDPKEIRREMGFMESRQSLKLLNKMKDKMKEAFQQRMNDFQFEVLTPEEPEEEREPKKFDDFAAQFDHDD